MYENLKANLKRNKIDFSYFDTQSEAKEYLFSEVKGERVAFGGSMTVKDMGLYELLKTNNLVFWHWEDKNPNQREIEAEVTTYILSANAVAETGEIVNIDGTANRVSNAMYGPSKVYYVVGTNKIEPDLHKAIERARNIASPLNAKRLGLSTPCTVDGKCQNCSHAHLICTALTIIMAKTGKQPKCKVILIGEKLGY